MSFSEKEVLKLFFPVGVFEWFDVIGGAMNEVDCHIVLQEKNEPPIPKNCDLNKIIPKGFTEITITDFPIRGRRGLITFKRRYWQIEGQNEYLKRDIKLCFPGTKLEQEFADFLKEDG